MADALNTVRLHDNAITNQNRDLQYDLDRRAERLARKTSEQPMDWDEFNLRHPSEIKVESKWDHAINWGIKGAVIGAILLGATAAFTVGLVALEVGITIITPVAAVLSGIAAVVAGSGIGAAIGGANGALLSVFDDQKPEIRKMQLEKYRSYLDGFEKSHVVETALQLEQGMGTKWRDLASQSKLASSEVVR